jgi:uncharacterized Zn finger protein
MTAKTHYPLMLKVLQTVSTDRLQRAVNALADGSLTVALTQQTETEVRGFVTNSDGREYGVVLNKEQASCSCKDAMYRKATCKHAVVLALSVIRAGETKTQEQHHERRAPDLRLRKGRTSDELTRDRVPRRLPSLPFEEWPC